MHNLFSGLPDKLPDELVEVLAQGKGVRIEKIVSTGHKSPAGFWYDQEHAEWVLVLKGKARLRFDGDAEPVEMKPGDHLLIPAHRKHRVEWTSVDEPTVWLAVLFEE